MLISLYALVNLHNATKSSTANKVLKRIDMIVRRVSIVFMGKPFYLNDWVYLFASRLLKVDQSFTQYSSGLIPSTGQFTSKLSPTTCVGPCAPAANTALCS